MYFDSSSYLRYSSSIGNLHRTPLMLVGDFFFVVYPDIFGIIHIVAASHDESVFRTVNVFVSLHLCGQSD